LFLPVLTQTQSVGQTRDGLVDIQLSCERQATVPPMTPVEKVEYVPHMAIR